jgi:hypothetical protein
MRCFVRQPFYHTSPVRQALKTIAGLPAFSHATKRWTQKIKGKMYYFGRWDDPAGALREYHALSLWSRSDAYTRRGGVLVVRRAVRILRQTKSFSRAAAVMAITAGCLSFLSREMA